MEFVHRGFKGPEFRAEVEDMKNPGETGDSPESQTCGDPLEGWCACRRIPDSRMIKKCPYR